MFCVCISMCLSTNEFLCGRRKYLLCVINYIEYDANQNSIDFNFMIVYTHTVDSTVEIFIIFYINGAIFGETKRATIFSRVN